MLIDAELKADLTTCLGWEDRDYFPQTGDLIFFDWNNDNNPNHVGIVEKVEDNTVYTIEGNSRDE